MHILSKALLLHAMPGLSGSFQSFPCNLCLIAAVGIQYILHGPCCLHNVYCMVTLASPVRPWSVSKCMGFRVCIPLVSFLTVWQVTLHVTVLLKVSFDCADLEPRPSQGLNCCHL